MPPGYRKDTQSLLEQGIGRSTFEDTSSVKACCKIRNYDDLSEEQMDFIDSLEPLNIEARYPSYK